MALQPICISNSRESPTGSIGRSPYQVGVAQTCSMQVRIGQVRPAEVGLAQIDPAQVRTEQIGPVEVRLAQISPEQLCAA